MYESLYNEAQRINADMVICDFRYSKSGSASQCPDELTSISVLECITSRSRTILHGATWNKLLKAEIAKREKFPIGVSYCEDVTYWCKVLKNNLKIAYLSRIFYNYDFHPGSLCSVKSRESLMSDFRHIKMIESLKTNTDMRYDACLNSYMTSIVFHRAFMSGLLSNREFVAYCTVFKPCFKYSNSNVVRVSLSMSIYGFATQALLLCKVFNKLKYFGTVAKGFVCRKS